MGPTQTENWPGLAREVLAIVRCLECQSELRQEDDALVCVSCAKRYPVVKGVPRFVDQQFYTGSFGFQWLKHNKTQLDDENSRRSEKDFILRTRLEPADLAGKLVLDVGCGMGRYAEVATRWGARVVGIDLSQAVEAAAANLRERDASILQADALRLPFAPESFDYIYSLGVLHHTPDCERAVKGLARYLKPGGTLSVWLYSAYNPWYRMSDFYRKLTRRMSPRVLHTLCQGTIPLYGIHQILRKIPLLGRPMSGVIRYLIPMSFNADPEWRVLDTFDWYSPWYQSKHTYEEVFRWFESCGLRDLTVGDVPIAVRGRKPGAARLDSTAPDRETESCAG
ncbi:MAG: methyltransferase domain-containing protein [Candidatus Sulfotelmatobacter sp.]